MATTNEYIEYVCEQIKGVGEIRYKKMFGEFMVYVNNKPVIILDIDDSEFCKSVIIEVEKVTPIPKPKKKK